MKTSKIKNLDIVPPSQESGAYKTPDNLPKAHQVCIAVGKRNSGKSTSIVNLIEKMGYDYCIAVSPTMASNRELMERLNIEHTFDDVDNPNIVDDIKKIVQDEADDLERFQRELKEYNQLMSDLKKGKYLEDDVILKFFGDDSFVKPTHRFNGRKPMIAVIVDDCLGSNLFSRPRKLNGLSTYSRHIGSLKDGGSIGVSLYFMIQSFKCQTGGLNKVIRNQCTSMILFKTKDKSELKDIAESVSGEIDEELFYKVYDTAIKEPYDFLFIDLHKKKEHMSCFRRNLNEFIIVEDLKNGDENVKNNEIKTEN
jgi:hypothetical protein